MRHPTRWLYPSAAVCLTALQLSCGDSSGPGPVASTIEANSPTTISSPPNAPVPEPPSVIVRDTDGEPLAGATVTFAVTSGGGTITGATQTTNSLGVATVGSWTLGSVPGNNTLTATVEGVAPLVFLASSIDPCTVATPHTLGSTTQGTLATGDCRFEDGSYVDYYGTSLPAGTYLFNQSSGEFDTYLFMLTAAGVPVGVNDDIIPGENQNSRLKAILPAGNYILAANSYDPFETGPYTLTSASTQAEVTNCEDVFVMRGISTAQSLQTTDCPSNGYSDEYVLFLGSGQSVTVTMASTTVDSFLTLLGPGISTPLTNDNREAGTNDAQLTYTVPSTQFGGFFIIRAGSAVSGATGQYTLTIE